MAARPWDYRDGSIALRGELYPPQADPNGRAVLVVHEADGIGPNVRRCCERLARLGYVAGAADMHGGGKVLDAEEIPAALGRFTGDAALIRRRVGAAYDALLVESGLTASHVAAMGYCFGGYATLELARSGVAAAAVVSFHGLLSSPAPARPGDIRAPILVATGALDPLVPPEQVAAFEQEMRSAEADWHLLTHGRAYHSFTNEGVERLNDPRMHYDPAADAISWAAAMAFLDAGFATRA